MDTICQLKELDELYLAGTAISEIGISRLAALSIETLDVSYCDVTDAWITPLQQLKLKQLVAFGCGLTESAKEELESSNPGLKIID